jgi:GlpG protein
LRGPPYLTTPNVRAAWITVSLGVFAGITTLAWGSGKDVSSFFSDYRSFHGEPWRLATSVLPHIHLGHLAFNLYWLWVFGLRIEGTLGHFKTALLYLFLAAGSSAIAGIFGEDGVGLSGVGYGLFGFLLVLSRWDERFRGALNRPTILLFVCWFFLCIFLTHTKAMPVANIAHGAGAVLGALAGIMVARHWTWMTSAVVAGSILILAFTVGLMGRPYLNFLGDRAAEWEYEASCYAHEAYLCQERGDHEEAVRLYRKALDIDEAKALYWFNLGISYQSLNRFTEARAAYERATGLDPRDARYRAARDGLEHVVGDDAGKN